VRKLSERSVGSQTFLPLLREGIARGVGENEVALADLDRLPLQARERDEWQPGGNDRRMAYATVTNSSGSLVDREPIVIEATHWKDQAPPLPVPRPRPVPDPI
jgi:hypothetical protein